MLFDQSQLLDALDSVTSIPIIPFRDGVVDYAAHDKNIEYLMVNNHLEGDRNRVIGIAGTSLIHHIGLEQQVKIIDATGQCMAGRGLLISGVVPNPISDAGRLIEAQSGLRRVPDAFLLMPLTGVSSPEGVYATYMEFAERYGSSCNARFIYYLRNKGEREIVLRLINDSPHFIGVKIGTDADDVEILVDGVDKDNGIVMWGIGDRSTGPAERGTRGHTSGINVVFARASDAINNAQRRKDYAAARLVEEAVTPLEDIRFRNGRMYNYSAVVEAMHIAAFNDIEGGEGGPFNPRVPSEVAREISAAIAGICHYH